VVHSRTRGLVQDTNCTGVVAAVEDNAEDGIAGAGAEYTADTDIADSASTWAAEAELTVVAC